MIHTHAGASCVILHLVLLLLEVRQCTANGRVPAAEQPRTPQSICVTRSIAGGHRTSPALSWNYTTRSMALHTTWATATVSSALVGQFPFHAAHCASVLAGTTPEPHVMFTVAPQPLLFSCEGA